MTCKGFNVEEVQYKSLNLTVWDVGGQSKIRPLWRHCIPLLYLSLPDYVLDYQNTDAVIYVVDSSDPERLEESRAELSSLLQDVMEATGFVLI